MGDFRDRIQREQAPGFQAQSQLAQGAKRSATPNNCSLNKNKRPTVINMIKLNSRESKYPREQKTI